MTYYLLYLLQSIHAVLRKRFFGIKHKSIHYSEGEKLGFLCEISVSGISCRNLFPVRKPGMLALHFTWHETEKKC